MTEYHFTEREPYEAGFSKFFHQRIVPVLDEIEANRGQTNEEFRKNSRKLRKLGGRAILAGIAIDVLLSILFFPSIFFTMCGFGLFVFLTIAGRGKLKKIYADSVSDRIVPLLCEFLGDMKPTEPRIDLAKFGELIPFSGSGHLETENGIAGDRLGISYDLCEVFQVGADTTRRGRHRERDFHGIAMRISLVNPGPRLVFLQKLSSGLQDKIEKWTIGGALRGMEAVEGLDPELSRHFAIYSDDPDAARAYLDPSAAAGLLQIVEEQKSRYFASHAWIEAAFDGSWFYLKVPLTHDFLSIGDIRKSMMEVEEDLHRALFDLTLPRRLIDRLAG
jgi:hypothetical protein